MKRKALLTCFVLAALLSGCGTLRHSSQGYYGPESGPVAKVRFFNVAHDPQVFTSDTVDYSKKPAGHVNSWGHGKHDIGMPKIPSEKGEGYVEASVRAGSPVTIRYVTETAVDMAQNIEATNMINSGRYDVVVSPSRNACSHPILKRTFIPRSGANYEARYITDSDCPIVKIKMIDTSGPSIRLSPVKYVPTMPCDDDVKGSDCE